MKKIKAVLIAALSISSCNIYAEISPVQQAFFCAVSNNNPEGVKAAIKNGADINMVDPKTGTTALYQVLLRVDKYIGKNWAWVLPLVALSLTSLLSARIGYTSGIHLSRAAKSTTKNVIRTNDDRPWYFSTEAPKGYAATTIPVEKVKKIRAASFVISLGSAIATGLIGRISYKFLSNILKDQEIAQILATNPKIKIDDKTDNLRKQIMSKLPQSSTLSNELENLKL